MQGGGESAAALAYALKVGHAAKAPQVGLAANALQLHVCGAAATALAYALQVGPAAKALQGGVTATSLQLHVCRACGDSVAGWNCGESAAAPRMQGGGESAAALAYALKVGPAAEALQFGVAAKALQLHVCRAAAKALLPLHTPHMWDLRRKRCRLELRRKRCSSTYAGRPRKRCCPGIRPKCGACGDSVAGWNCGESGAAPRMQGGSESAAALAYALKVGPAAEALQFGVAAKALQLHVCRAAAKALMRLHTP
jgi:hypothetical protein